MIWVEMTDRGLNVEEQVEIPVLYRGIDLGTGYRADLIVEQKVIVEIKSVKCLDDIHRKQILTYLKLTGYRLGILVNFTTNNIDRSIVRVVNQL